MRCQDVVLATSLAVSIAGSVASAASSGRTAVQVGFTVRGNAAASVTTTPGTTVGFLARASMRKGDHIVVLAQRASESKPRSIATCSAVSVHGHLA